MDHNAGNVSRRTGKQTAFQNVGSLICGGSVWLNSLNSTKSDPETTKKQQHLTFHSTSNGFLLYRLPWWWVAQMTDWSVHCTSYITQVTLSPMRLWQTITNFTVIFYIASRAAVCKPQIYTAVSTLWHKISPKSEGHFFFSTSTWWAGLETNLSARSTAVVLMTK